MCSWTLVQVAYEPSGFLSMLICARDRTFRRWPATGAWIDNTNRTGFTQRSVLNQQFFVGPCGVYIYAASFFFSRSLRHCHFPPYHQGTAKMHSLHNINPNLSFDWFCIFFQSLIVPAAAACTESPLKYSQMVIRSSSNFNWSLFDVLPLLTSGKCVKCKSFIWPSKLAMTTVFCLLLEFFLVSQSVKGLCR